VLNILLADDSMTAQNMGKKILSEAGYEVTTVSNGAAALKKISDKTPDLVILDIYMPGYTGLEVCERIKRGATTSGMPVLLSVGKLEPYREQDAAAVRADGVIIKPFEATELVTTVTNVILRASGISMDAATRAPISPAAIPAAQASPAAEPEAPPVIPVDYSAELATLESQPQDGGSAVTYGPTTTDERYLNASLPPTEPSEPTADFHPSAAIAEAPGTPIEKAAAMAAPGAVAAAEPANFAPASQTAEATSAMPFMIDELLKAEEKVPAEDHFSGPMLDVSPVEVQPDTRESPRSGDPGYVAAEDIEVIEIPAPEPQPAIDKLVGDLQPEQTAERLVMDSAVLSAGTQVTENAAAVSQVAVPEEVTADGTGVSPEELTAREVEAFLREHAAGAGAESVSTVELKSDGDVYILEGAGAIAAKPDDSTTASTELVPEANAMPAPPLHDLAAPRIAGDDRPVFEVEDEPLFALDMASAVETAAIIEEPAAQPKIEKPLVATDIAPAAVSTPTATTAAIVGAEPAVPAPAPEERPPVALEAPTAQKQEPVAQVSVTPKPEPESAPALVPSAAKSVAESTPSAAEDFMFSVPMTLEGTAAMSLRETPDRAPRAALESPDASTLGVPAHAAEAARAAAPDEAAIAGAVQRVLDRFKPQIVAEIIRELAKHKP
jgi:DNA-binding response OmpR family regulator